MIDYIADKIKSADLILVGIGEELDALREIKVQLPEPENRFEMKMDQEDRKGSEEEYKSWMLPYIRRARIKDFREKRAESYQALSLLLQGKNYFIVSLCQDGLIKESALDQERIVEPCGGYDKLQCSEACSKELYDVPQEFRLLTGDVADDEEKISLYRRPVCPHCGRPLVFNNVDASKYIEDEYLGRWAVYRKWLQGTVNKAVCLLEIGVGMKYPTVIRWPFEKITYYNQKAELFRIHSRLYQVTEEISGRGYGICRRPEEFLKEMSEVFI